MKENYQKQTDAVIAGLTARPRLLLHVCCAPCSSYVLEYLEPHFDVTVHYYNPNISPASEYALRYEELRRLIATRGDAVELADVPYDPERFFAAVKGLEREPEGGARCAVCFRLRLGEAVAYAAEHGFDYVTTTLTISPLKNASLLNQIGQELASRAGVAWLPSDFKKKGGYQRSIELSRQYNLYRQNYCGCPFSREEARRRAETKRSDPSAGSS